MITTRKNIKT